MGKRNNIGTLGGAFIYPNDINNFGKVVGTGDINYPDITVSHAFLWENGELKDLNTLLPSGSGWTLEKANAINDFGWIVGQGYIQNQAHAFLMKPNVVPEPISCALFLVGGGALALAKRRKMI